MFWRRVRQRYLFRTKSRSGNRRSLLARAVYHWLRDPARMPAFPDIPAQVLRFRTTTTRSARLTKSGMRGYSIQSVNLKRPEIPALWQASIRVCLCEPSPTMMAIDLAKELIEKYQRTFLGCSDSNQSLWLFSNR
jgi:hypothetical protein